MLPVIALVGRPNVGKSTLFNRLTRTRDALVADFPGLTRDRKYGQANCDGYEFIVVDTGGIDGMLSLVGMVPDEKLGIVILTNYSPNYFRPALFYHIIDEFFNVESRDWNQFYLEETRKVNKHFSSYERIVNENRKRGRSPDFEVDNILGSYTNDAYGTIEVSRERRELLLKHWGSSLLGDLEHWNNNTYRLTWRDPALSDATDKLFINFNIDSQSRIKLLGVELIQDIDIEKGPVFQEVVFNRDITTK